MATNKCDTCQHWHPKNAAARAENFAVGECHAGPPPRDFAWSRTKATDSCGAHSTQVQFATATPARRGR